MKKNYLLTIFAIASVVLQMGCSNDEFSLLNSNEISQKSGPLMKSSGILNSIVPIGTAYNFAVLGGTSVSNVGETYINGDLGVGPGSAVTGFQPEPIDTIEGPGVVTEGLGVVNGKIYAGGAVANQAHNDAVFAYDYLIAQEPIVYVGDIQLDGMTFTPGVYFFEESANLKENGKVYLDFQGNNDALFIFKSGSTITTMTGSNVVAINNNADSCTGTNVYWVAYSSVKLAGANFLGTVIAKTSISVNSIANVAGRILALDGAVTMVTDTISVCGLVTRNLPGIDYVTGSGWINNNETFVLSAGIKDEQFWGELAFNDSVKNTILVSTSVTAYIVIDALSRQFEGTALINGNVACTYKVIVIDNSESGTIDAFNIILSNGYKSTGTGILLGGNINIRTNYDTAENVDEVPVDDNDVSDTHNNCNNGNYDHKKHYTNNYGQFCEKHYKFSPNNDNNHYGHNKYSGNNYGENKYDKNKYDKNNCNNKNKNIKKDYRN